MPGYVLIEAYLSGEIVHRLRNTPNVIGFLEEKTIYLFLFANQVNRILGTMDEMQKLAKKC